MLEGDVGGIQRCSSDSVTLCQIIDLVSCTFSLSIASITSDAGVAK